MTGSDFGSRRAGGSWRTHACARHSVASGRIRTQSMRSESCSARAQRTLGAVASRGSSATGRAPSSNLVHNLAMRRFRKLGAARERSRVPLCTCSTRSTRRCCSCGSGSHSCRRVAQDPHHTSARGMGPTRKHHCTIACLLSRTLSRYQPHIPLHPYSYQIHPRDHRGTCGIVCRSSRTPVGPRPLLHTRVRNRPSGIGPNNSDGIDRRLPLRRGCTHPRQSTPRTRSRCDLLDTCVCACRTCRRARWTRRAPRIHTRHNRSTSNPRRNAARRPCMPSPHRACTHRTTHIRSSYPTWRLGSCASALDKCHSSSCRIGLQGIRRTGPSCSSRCTAEHRLRKSRLRPRGTRHPGTRTSSTRYRHCSGAFECHSCRRLARSVRRSETSCHTLTYHSRSRRRTRQDNDCRTRPSVLPARRGTIR